MEGVRSWWSSMVVLVLMCALLVMIPQVSGTRWIVGANMGWTTTVNYTIWAQDKHFYNGDWLFFVYDRNRMDVLEVNRTDYDSYSSDQPLHNWTIGAGRDVVPLNVTRDYYFISGKGVCSDGMKVAICVENLAPPPATSPISVGNPLRTPIASPIGVENLAPQPSPKSVLNLPPPPPTASPIKETRGSRSLNSGGQYILPAVFAIGAVWDAFVRFFYHQWDIVFYAFFHQTINTIFIFIFPFPYNQICDKKLIIVFKIFVFGRCC